MSHKTELAEPDIPLFNDDEFGNEFLHVWYAWVDKIDCRALEARLIVLSQSERKRYESFYFAPDRDRFLAAHLLKRHVLAKYLKGTPEAVEIELDSLGKPHVNQSGSHVPIHFNMTHTHDLVACAVANRRVGIDAEFLGRKLTQSATEMFLSDAELKLVQSLDPNHRSDTVLEMWTLKEAYLKGVGVGLQKPPKKFSFHTFVPRDSSRLPFQAQFDDAEWMWEFFREFQLFAGYVVATAVELERCDNLSAKGTDKVDIRYLNGTNLLQ